MNQLWTACTQLLRSASRLAFLSLMLTACAMAFTGRLSQENFMLLAGAASAAYFSSKSESPK